MKQVFTAKTVAEAKALAVSAFNVTEDRITFNVLEEPKKTLFGFKGEARVEAEYEQTKPEMAADYIKAVMMAMGFECPEIAISDIEGGALLDISGEGAEGIIGRRGEVIDAMQYLASLVCNRSDKDYYRISTDCDGFRARRKVQLEELAKKMVSKAKRTGRTVALEPMNPYERRIIHAAVSEIEGATSRSTGEEPYRKVLISSTERKPYNRDSKGEGRGDRRGRGGRDGRKGGRGKREDFKARSLDISSSFEKDYKKPKLEDDTLGAGLYAKIEF